MNTVVLLGSLLMGVSFGVLVHLAGKALLTPDANGTDPSKIPDVESNALLKVLDRFLFVRLLTRKRVQAQRRIVPKRWHAHIVNLWELSGYPMRQSVFFIARLEVLLIVSFLGFFLPLLLVFGLIGSLIIAGAYAALVSFSAYYSFKNRVQRRLRAIDRELPYALDLLSMMLAGGGNIFNSLEVLGQSRTASPLLQELRAVTSSLYAGKTFLEALRDFADRVDLDNVRSIVLAIEQGQHLGTPMHQILKSHATTIRNKRILTAEEQAHTAGTKIFIPATLVMLALVIVMLAPSVIKMFPGR